MLTATNRLRVLCLKVTVIGTAAVVVMCCTTARAAVGDDEFSGTLAFDHVAHLVAMGPRPPGSDTLNLAQQYIVADLQSHGLTVREEDFVASTPRGSVPMTNIVAVCEGNEPGVLIIGTHYDTKLFDEFEFVGANDGTSGVGVLLELGRLLGGSRQGLSVWLVFFDGEEAIETWGPTDSLYGSREMVRRLVDTGEISSIRAMVLLDMIGDRYLTVQRDLGAPDWLVEAIRSAAVSLGNEQYFFQSAIGIQDDHIPFRGAGVPAIDLIDFMYGADSQEHYNTWHTQQDTLDKVSATSLEIVGRVTLLSIDKIESELFPEPPPIPEGMPTAGMLGLGLLAAACALGGTLVLRKGQPPSPQTTTPEVRQ